MPGAQGEWENQWENPGAFDRRFQIQIFLKEVRILAQGGDDDG